MRAGLLAGSSAVPRPLFLMLVGTDALCLMYVVLLFLLFKLLVWNKMKCILRCILACCFSLNFKSYALGIKYT